jgi:hypothetical protein
MGMGESIQRRVKVESEGDKGKGALRVREESRAREIEK